MKRSTTSSDRSHRLWAVAFWIAVWQLLAMAVGQRVLLASPLETAKRLVELIPTLEYWRSILFTLGHILAGFLAACLAAVSYTHLDVYKRQEFKVTRERIRQIEAKALRKLRHPSRSRKLKDSID